VLAAHQRRPGRKGRRWYAWSRVALGTADAPEGWERWLLLRRSNEIHHRFAALACQPAGDRGHRLRWSWWRRRHQARARACHYRRQAAQQP